MIPNPPFSIALDEEVRSNLSATFDLAADRNSENLFLERWYQLLKHGGRLAAVLPESFFSTGENLLARLFLFAHFDVRAVVSLPSHAFQPWTPTRTSLLFAYKKSPEDERLWKETFDAHRSEVAASAQTGSVAARAVMRPGRRTTEEQLANHASDIQTALAALNLSVLADPSDREEWATQASEALKSFGVDGEAFSRTVTDISVPDYTGVIVREIGYRRTKRGESSRRNDLFSAVVEVDGGTMIRVQNLNDAPDQWKIVKVADGDDALSYLAGQRIWD